MTEVNANDNMVTGMMKTSNLTHEEMLILREYIRKRVGIKGNESVLTIRTYMIKGSVLVLSYGVEFVIRFMQGINYHQGYLTFGYLGTKVIIKEQRGWDYDEYEEMSLLESLYLELTQPKEQIGYDNDE